VSFVLVINHNHFVILIFLAVCTAGRMLIGRRIALLYAVTFLLILPVLFRNVRHSAFYLFLDKTVLQELMKNANSQRIVEAEKYFSSLNNSGVIEHSEAHGNVTSDEAVTVALTIVTVSRNRHEIDSYEPKYLTQTVWKFHSLLEKWHLYSQHLRVHLAICNVDAAARSYHESRALSAFVPMFPRFNETHFSMVHVLEKEKQDYVFCLNASLQAREEAKYIFLVEDDAMPTDDIFHVFQRVLLMHAEQSYVLGEFHPQPSDIAFIKFYHPERLLNFISLQPERLPELFSYAVLLSTLLTVVCVVSCGLAATGNVDSLWSKLFLFSVTVMLVCGRPGISEWRRLASPVFYSYTPAPSCCTPAMLFPRPAALLAVSYLSASTCSNNFGKDSVLDQMLEDMRMRAYLVQPNTFTHIGLYSSLRQRIVDPFIV